VDFNDTTFSAATSAGDLALATQYPIVTGLTSGMFGNASVMSAGDVSLLGLSGTQYEITQDGQRFWIKVGSFTLVPLAPVLVPEPGTTGFLGGLALLGLARRRRK
jgi:PEP-CTERM motif